MYKPYLSRQKSGKSVQTTVSAGDKTTLKLVTEQLRASQKVLNKSDQFIPAQRPGGGGAARSCALRPPPAPGLGQWEGAVRVRWTNHSGAGLSCMASLCHTGHPPLGHAIDPSVPYHSTIVPLSTIHPTLAPYITALVVPHFPECDSDVAGVHYMCLWSYVSKNNIHFCLI